MYIKTDLIESNIQAEPFYSVPAIFMRNLPPKLQKLIATDLEYGDLAGEGDFVERTVKQEQMMLIHSNTGQEIRQTGAQPARQLDDSVSQPKRILVVDDEKYITFMLKEGLEEIPNCEIVTASTGEQALQLCQTQPFDMLISDYRMTGIDGLTLATRVRQAYPQTVVIILTAHSSDMLLAQAAKISIRRVLNKPIKLPEIRQLVSEVLSGKSNNQTVQSLA